MQNKYFVRSRMSEAEFREIVRLFFAGLTADQTALLSKTNRKKAAFAAVFTDGLRLMTDW